MNEGKTLEQTRAEWEEGMDPLSVIDLKNTGCVLVILDALPGDLNSRNRYNCHRYFQINFDWVCSVDGERVPLEAVFSWLNDPRVATTKPRNYVTPKPTTIEA